MWKFYPLHQPQGAMTLENVASVRVGDPHDAQCGFPGRLGDYINCPRLISLTVKAPWRKRRPTLYFPVFRLPGPHCGEMSYKVVVGAKRAKREEAIRDTVALTTRELSKEEQRITSSSGTFHLGGPPSSF